MTSTQQARSEIEAISIYNHLITDGYQIETYERTWVITEPQKRFMPQTGRAFQNMREVMKWAEGVESIRFVTDENLKRGLRKP